MTDTASGRGTVRAAQTLRLIARLCGHRENSEPTPLSEGKCLPMVCLVWRQEPGPGHPRGAETARTLHLLDPIDRYLRDEGEGRIPRLLINLPYQEAPGMRPGPLPRTALHEVSFVRGILSECSRRLIGGPSAQGRIRYPLFGLLDWLIRQSPRGDRELRKDLRERWWNEHALMSAVARAGEGADRESSNPPQSPSSGSGRHVRKPGWITALLGAVISRAGLAAKLFLPVRPLPSWFIQQRYLPPHDRRDPVGFALRLTEAELPQQDPEQVCLLLVNAFLEDLRRAYRCRPGRRRPNWYGRRMAPPVLFLDGITRTNGGYRLLALINAVRNETGLPDPLLVISGSRRVPPDAEEPQPPGWEERPPQETCNAWRKRRALNARDRRPASWYLPITVPSPAELAVHCEHFTDVISISRPPRWSIGKYQLPVVVLFASALGIAGVLLSNHISSERCGADWWNSGTSGLVETAGECIGITSGGYPFQPAGTADLVTVERQVASLDQQASSAHATSPGRPYITVIYLGALTTTTTPVEDLTAEREQLEGVAAAEKRQLLTGTGPIVKVLIANGGTDMLHGMQVAAMLSRMAAADPGIVGVVGLDQSRQPTFDTIKALAGTGLPLVAAALSADQLAGPGGRRPVTPFYFQIAPQNEREAQFAARYARSRLYPRRRGHAAPEVRILYSDDTSDIYSNNLGQDAAAAFGDAGFQVQTATFAPGSAQDSGRQACGFPGLVFFAGRAEDFQDFLGGVDAVCPATPPQIIGDDDVARFVADPARLDLYQAIPFRYVSFAIGQPSCAAATGNDLYGIMDKLFPFECRSPTAPLDLDGHAALAYDAAETIINATEYLQASGFDVPVTPGTVWDAISSLHGTYAYAGQSGEVDFGGMISQHVPLDKAIAMIWQAQGAAQPVMTGFCGASDNLALRQDAWCPPQP